MFLPNPFAFRPAQVTFWTTITYLALLVPIIYLQEAVPGAPAESALPRGISLSEAWADLANLTGAYHPANSHANELVRNFLIQRIREILDDNGVTWTTQEDRVGNAASPTEISASRAGAGVDAVLFDDMRANVTYTSSGSDGTRSVMYYEGTNVYVYVRGTDDAPGEWWQPGAEAGPSAKQLVLVNAHYDAVSSSFGATDDGVGVVTSLQLLRYFTTPGHQPRRGIVVLLNNAEEDFLLGASAFVNSPLAPFIGSFVNLEGAGAGGKAMLFRSTDLEVVSAYRRSPHPFASVVASDSFKSGLIRSETDYRIWVDVLGYRGLDIAFFRPRARYHTTQDNRRHTSRNSVWHMLSSALASMQGLSGDLGGRVDSHRTVGVWFDLFGNSLVLFALRGLFAWSLTILIVSPLVLALVFYVLYRADKDYLFRASVSVGLMEEAAEKVPLDGWKGFSRFPLALVVAEAFVLGAALLIKKVQPFIIYSSLYAVLALMTSLFYCVFWFVMRGADASRPSAFHRTYSLIWLYVLTWPLLVYTAVVEDQKKIASGYIVAFWASSVFVATVVSLLENLSLQKKGAYAEGIVGVADADISGSNPAEDVGLIAPGPEEAEDGSPVHETTDDDDEIPTEASPLIGGNARNGRPTTFATNYRRSVTAILNARRHHADGERKPQPFPSEQAWSGRLPTWTWLVQFLIIGPFTIIITAQQGLAIALSVQQTGTDGSNLLTPYLLIAFFTTFVFLPITPFIHRVTRHIPIFFAVIFVGTLVYCLSSFPFSPASPYKVFIRQTFSADTGTTSIILTGHEAYLLKIKADLPFAVGKPWTCSPSRGRQTGLVDCALDGTGLEPHLDGTETPFSDNYARLVTINATRSELKNKATIEINAVNSKSCALHFEKPFKQVSVRDSANLDTRFPWAPGAEVWPITDVTLWRRDWETPWLVDVELGDDDAETVASTVFGSVVCRWADVNTPGTVPAVDEAWKFAPKWSVVSIKSNPPLVEGTKGFSV
ncbi:peptidase family m28 family [Grosmannia clavigera kw1407]|uniref:Peptide hydrolase n=1 Tax=Grosmannia clavigera (strain kw1407 / UAMH 11150) TaxID=655863 RepID=F0XME8_GROCL|nr:peptidase family m28 family [Grosmannia clavigera kw1407]EFX01258.1 peptidase family m28 family [Grosmannia clavigera kw1407]